MTDVSLVHGALGGLIALLLWLYACRLVMLAGREADAVLDAGRALGSRS